MKNFCFLKNLTLFYGFDSERGERWRVFRIKSSSFLKIWFQQLLLQQAEKIVSAHDPSKPLFLYLPFQNVHSPVQAPQAYVDKYKFISDVKRRTYAAMVDIVDEAIGNVTRAFKERG